MKFFGRLLIPLLTIAASDASTIRKTTFDTANLDKKKLMAHAQPKKGAHRDLQNVQLTGRESIVFKSCETLSVDVEVDNANIQEAMTYGNIKAVKSYVEFDVCRSEYCNTGIEGTRTTYVTSLADYMAAFSEFLPTKQQEYCQACVEHVDYCPYQYTSYTDQEIQENQVNNGGRNGGHRSLKGEVIYEQIDCSRCYKYGCLFTNNEYYNADQEWAQQRSMEWMKSVANCYRDNENQVVVNGMRASFGFMCNQEGTGVEIAVFMDDECTLYNSQVAFANLMSTTDSYLWSKSKANVQYMFNNDFSCYDPDVVYVGPDFDWTNAQNSNYQGEDYEPEASEWCWKAFTGDMTPVALSDCGGQGYYDYMQYNYTLSQDEAKDASAVCTKLNVSGGGDYLYSRYTSGAMYSYVSRSKSSTTSSSTTNAANVASTNGTLTENDWMTTLDEQSPDYRSSPYTKGTPAWMYALCAVVAAGFVVTGVVLKFKKSLFSSEKEEPILSTDYVAAVDNKQNIDHSKLTMA